VRGGWPHKDFEREHIVPQQERRYKSDPWEDKVAAYLEMNTKVLIGKIAFEALSIETPRLGRAEQNRIIAILERRGWSRLTKDWKGNIYWTRNGI
jgi:predicted P-loop ATPase